MNALKDAVLHSGQVLSGKILKVDSFLNHQVDPQLMQQVGHEIAQRFANQNITKVLTIESSGIPPAMMAALELQVPLIFARKQKSLTLTDHVITAKIYSYTKETEFDVTVSKQFLGSNDRVLIVDDFLANGEAALGLAKIVESAGASIIGFSILIEKSFQPGRQRLEEAGYVVDSLVRIKSLENNRVELL